MRRRALGAARLAAVAVVVLSLLAFVGVAVGPHSGRYRTLTVLSGSMRPAFAAGDLLVVTPEPIRRLRLGDVIAYAIPVGDRHVETHRVVGLRWRDGEPIVRTKGDANAQPDPWTAQLHGATAWRPALVVPMAGRLIVWLRRPLVHTVLQLVVPPLFVLFGLFSIWSRAGVPRRRRFLHVGRA